METKPRMTKKEILDDVLRYIKKNGRGIDEQGNCLYITPEGKHCAHSMALKPSHRKGAVENYLLCAGDVINHYGDKCHQKKYQGHRPRFWEKVQTLHDTGGFWNENNELTFNGREYMKHILKYPY